MTRTIKSKLERNFTKVIPFELQADKQGYLIVYCDYHLHRGIVGNGKARMCLKNGCDYAKIFREET